MQTGSFMIVFMHENSFFMQRAEITNDVLKLKSLEQFGAFKRAVARPD
jgi:hypothetical protein